MRYPVVIHKEADSDFGVTVPDIPGCFSAGSTHDEALTNVVEAIECHLEGLLLDNESLPVGTSIDHWVTVPDYCGGIWCYVDIDVSQVSGKSIRINITLPEKVLCLIDLYTKNHSQKNRSSFLADAALCYMREHR